MLDLMPLWTLRQGNIDQWQPKKPDEEQLLTGFRRHQGCEAVEVCRGNLAALSAGYPAAIEHSERCSPRAIT